MSHEIDVKENTLGHTAPKKTTQPEIGIGFDGMTTMFRNHQRRGRNHPPHIDLPEHGRNYRQRPPHRGGYPRRPR